VTELVGALTAGAKWGALAAAPGLSGQPVYRKAVIVRTVFDSYSYTVSTSVEATVDAGPDHLVELEILGVTYGMDFRGRHDF
jgi:hypothetical protein